MLLPPLLLREVEVAGSNPAAANCSIISSFLPLYVTCSNSTKVALKTLAGKPSFFTPLTFWFSAMSSLPRSWFRFVQYKDSGGLALHRTTVIIVVLLDPSENSTRATRSFNCDEVSTRLTQCPYATCVPKLRIELARWPIFKANSASDALRSLPGT